MPEVAEATTVVEDEISLDSDLELEDGDENEDEEDGEEGKTKSKRPRFSEDNTWVFEVEDKSTTLEQWVDKKHNVTADAAKQAAMKLVYTDNTPVNDDPKKLKTRIFRVTGKAKFNDDGDLISGVPLAMVLGTSASHASENYCKYLGIDFDLHWKIKKRGRTGTKIEASMVMFGKMLGQLVMGVAPQSGKAETNFTKVLDGVDPNYLAQYKEFCPGGKYGHYIDAESGMWKEPNV